MVSSIRAFSSSLFVLLLACRGGAPPEAPEVREPSAPAAATHSVDGRVSLDRDFPQPIPGIGGTATLLSSQTAPAAGDEAPRTTGVLRLVRAGVAQQVEFATGREFRAFGRRMVVQGTPDALVLVVQPVGAPAAP